ncbi:ROK family transcriptional regulator [Mesorhizobium sp.]|uniref:ROK family transcriptional regulator n=1 Tax=Mesorhizobium sp. TaxID=1871066 RepID=UPI000FE84088|nr:ROK family transcriptional regulator [Mesorhizobium sp.]RWB58197.1 MAG: ROK family transcriptional regulator [Mesorhizobium sp.]
MIKYDRQSRSFKTKMTKSLLRSLLDGQPPGTPESLIVRCLSQRGAISAAQIARLTGLARSTVSTALTGLRKSGIVVELPAADETAKGVGRPPATLTLNPEAGTCVGVHLSLDEIRVAVADVSHSFISEKIIPLGLDYPPDRAAKLTKAAIAQCYEENSLSASGLLGVGVSVSGPVSPEGFVQRASIVPTWAGVNIRHVFGPVLEQPIFAANESNCAAIAEMMWGAAAGYEDFVLFKIDLGVGGAIVQHGRVVTGIAGGAGEFGHMSIDPSGDLCRCGNRGCLELYASFNRPLEQIARVTGRRVTMDDVIRMAEQGDVGALRMIEDTAEMAGRGLGMIGSVLNPPLIIIGGRMALAGDILLTPLIAAYERHTLIKARDVAPDRRTRIIIGKHTENDVLLGAVGLVLSHYGRLQ